MFNERCKTVLAIHKLLSGRSMGIMTGSAENEIGI